MTTYSSRTKVRSQLVSPIPGGVLENKAGSFSLAATWPGTRAGRRARKIGEGAEAPATITVPLILKWTRLRRAYCFPRAGAPLEILTRNKLI